MTQTLTLSGRFAGPPRTGNGGYTAGRIAAQHATDRPVTVTLEAPAPLDVPLTVAAEDGQTVAWSGDTRVASARDGSFAAEPPTAVDLASAEAAQASYRGLVSHPFPGCFVCGTDRRPGDGLNLRPGLTGPGRTACVWMPDASLAAPEGEPGHVSPEFVWAALDCPGGWTSDLETRPLVLGRVTASCDGQVLVGEQYVVVGQHLRDAGRKTFTATALYDGSGRLLARAEHVWVSIDPATFNP